MLTENQKKIMARLLKGPQTAEELAGALNLTYAQISDELKQLLSQNLLKKEGYPTKYQLTQQLEHHVNKKLHQKEETASLAPFSIVLHALVEASGVEETLLKNALNALEEEMRKQPHYQIISCQQADPELHDERYYSFLDVELRVKDLTHALEFLFHYGPVSVEVLEPNSFNLTAHDFQEALTLGAQHIQRYVLLISQQLKRSEIEKFNSKFYAQQRTQSSDNRENEGRQ